MGKMRLQKEKFCLETKKKHVRRLFRTYLNIVYLLEGDLRVLMKKNGEAAEGRGSIVKCGKTLLEGRGLQKPVGLSLYDGPIKTVRYIWVNIWCMLGWILTCRLLWLNLRG